MLKSEGQKMLSELNTKMREYTKFDGSKLMEYFQIEEVVRKLISVEKILQ